MNHITFHTEQHDAWLRRSVRIISQPEREYYLEIPQQYAEWVSEHTDFLLVLAMHYLMELGGDFYVEGEVCPVLARNLEEYARVWSLWCPAYYKNIHIHAAKESTPRPLREDANEGIAAFSGGVDACYNVYGHQHKLFGLNSQEVTACVMLHGADIALENQADFDQAYNGAVKILDGSNIRLIPVRTNYRQYGQNWEWCFFSVVVAGLMMFSKRYALGSCGSDLPCDRFTHLPWGQNFVTDHLLSTSYFSMYVSGAADARTARCAHIGKEKAMVENLRVCWQSNSHGANCGVCEKCQRTILNLMAAGYGGVPSIGQFSLQTLTSAEPWDEERKAYYRDIITYNDTVSHALPENIRTAIIKKLHEPSSVQPAAPPYNKMKKRLINLIPISSWRRNMRKQHL